MYKYKIACMYLVTTEARAGWNRNYKWLRTAVWVLGIELCSSIRVASALNC